MASEWRTTTLGEVIELHRGYDLPGRDRRDGPYPIVSSSGVSGSHDEPKAKAPGVVIGRYGTLGEVHYITQDYWPLNTSLYVRDFKGNDPKFISYFLRSLDFGAYSDKAAVPGLNRNDLHTAVVRVPPVAEQRRIAGILGALDDKIELNRHMSQTLDSIARALFKSWFVDFDPVRAKAEGRELGLPQPVASLFPSALVDAAIGPTPEGWRVEALGSHLAVERGVSYNGLGLGSGGMPMHNLNSVYEGGGYKEGGIKFYGGEHRPQHVAQQGDLIVANTEQGHHRLLIGYAAIVPDRYPTGLFSHHLYRVQAIDGSPLSPEFLCWLLNSEVMHETVSGYANGTTVNMLPLAGLQRPLVCVPPAQLIRAFTSLARQVRLRSEAASRASITLASLRDATLARFFSTRWGSSDIGGLQGAG